MLMLRTVSGRLRRTKKNGIFELMMMKKKGKKKRVGVILRIKWPF